MSAPRKGRKVAPKAKARKMVECRARKPYALPQLLDSSTALSAANLEMYCRSAIRAAWEAGERGAMKAAREEIARCRLTPASIAAMARSLADYNDHRKMAGRRGGCSKDRLAVDRRGVRRAVRHGA